MQVLDDYYVGGLTFVNECLINGEKHVIKM